MNTKGSEMNTAIQIVSTTVMDMRDGSKKILQYPVGGALDRKIKQITAMLKHLDSVRRGKHHKLYLNRRRRIRKLYQ